MTALNVIKTHKPYQIQYTEYQVRDLELCRKFELCSLCTTSLFQLPAIFELLEKLFHTLFEILSLHEQPLIEFEYNIMNNAINST